MARSIGRPMAVLVLSDEERSYLERQVRRRRVARSISDRCRMILRCADGLTNKAVAAELGVHEHTVGKWRRRFLKERIEGLSDEPRPGRPRTLTDEQVAEVIERINRWTTTGCHPLVGSARWPGRADCRTRRSGRKGGLQRAAASKTFKLSSDRRSGARHHRPLSLAAGPRAECSVSTKRARSPGPQPAGPADAAGHARAAHTRLQASRHHLAVRSPRCRHGPRHRQVLQTPPGQGVPRLPEGDRPARPRGAGPPHRHGQLRHPQDRGGQGLAGAASALHVHFTPTSASWINQVERWFAELTRKQLQRGVHTSTRQLEADIRAFIEQHNEDPKPFKWTKSADDILAAVKRFCLRVDQNLCHEL